MANQNLLTGTVMLETIWKTRKMDLLDLISPFIIYAAAKVCSPGEIVDEQKTLEIIKTEFGYVDMPVAVVQRAMRRSRYFKRTNNKYKLTGNLDSIVANIEKRRDECEKKIQTIGEQLVSYFEIHTKTHRTITVDQAVQDLQGFFTRKGLFFGINRLEEHADGLKNREADYYIAQYLLEKKDIGAIEYDYAIDLVKGYFLQTAIYIQHDNGNIINSTYKDVAFYYDTPFLLRLLGYKTDEDNIGALELHNALKSQKAKTYYFPQTQHEIERILFTYENNIGLYSPQTLEGLDAKHYSSSDVDRLRRTWESKLNTVLETKLAPLPEYLRDARGNIDATYIIDENGLEDALKSNIKWTNKEAMDADLESVLGIHKLRGNIQSSEIEHCKAVFVTTNSRLSFIANRYYRDNVNNQTFPILITDSELAALTWIKCGSTGALPERQLLRNAYMAAQPTAEILEKFAQMLNKMQEEGIITTKMAVAIRSSGYAKKELLLSSFKNEHEIDENFITKIEKKLQDDYSADAREEEKQRAAEQRDRERHNRLANADKRAREAALNERNRILKNGRKTASIISLITIGAGLVGLIISIAGAIPRAPVLIVILIIFIILSGLSTIDTVKGKKKLIDHWLARRANQKYDKVYQEKRNEYISIAEGNDCLSLKVRR